MFKHGIKLKLLGLYFHSSYNFTFLFLMCTYGGYVLTDRFFIGISLSFFICSVFQDQAAEILCVKRKSETFCNPGRSARIQDYPAKSGTGDQPFIYLAITPCSNKYMNL